MVKDMIMDDINKTINDIIENFDKYDGSIESGIEIIQSNQISFDRLKKIPINEDIIGEDIYLQKLELFLSKQNKLLKILEKEKKYLFQKIQQINIKDKVVNNYMSTGIRPMFIDKNM